MQDTHETAVNVQGLEAMLHSRLSLRPGLLSAEIDGRELTAETPQRLRQKLITTLYETFHVGHDFGEERPRSYRDLWLEERLRSVTPHTDTLAAASLVAPGIVLVDGLRIRLPEPGGPASDGIALPAQRPGLSPGFFLVDGSCGRAVRRPLLRVYVHVSTSEEAVRAWGGILGALEGAQVPYRAKVTSSRRLFPRRDGLVVYLGEEGRHAVPLVAAAVQASIAPGSDALTSSFARTVAPGVALAWEPEDERPGMRGMSFGQHRAAAIADALFDHADEPSDQTLVDCLVKRLTAANIDPEALYRNLSSPDA